MMICTSVNIFLKKIIEYLLLRSLVVQEGLLSVVLNVVVKCTYAMVPGSVRGVIDDMPRVPVFHLQQWGGR